MSSRALMLTLTSNAAFRFDDCANFLRFFLPLVPSKVEQFITSRKVAVKVPN
jgi:hypothetical protein